VQQASISEYFEGVISDLDAVCYACYFAEIADYFCRENLDAGAMIQLLFISLKALINPNIPNSLVRFIFELRTIALNGECPEFFICHHCGESNHLDTYSLSASGLYCRNCHTLAKDGIGLAQSTVYTLQYIVTSPLEKLFTFTVSEEVLSELRMVLGRLCRQTFDRPMKSRDFLPEL
jgi:DNA repair protein RecO (recombination protein O)